MKRGLVMASAILAEVARVERETGVRPQMAMVCNDDMEAIRVDLGHVIASEERRVFTTICGTKVHGTGFGYLGDVALFANELVLPGTAWVGNEIKAFHGDYSGEERA